ncbi:MAG: thermonuclease family protein [Candidatus Aenigmarchaeota archaeon]|nr:thermonuclease family protein [Candidatus Aenigmarchaeota archaeon]
MRILLAACILAALAAASAFAALPFTGEVAAPLPAPPIPAPPADAAAGSVTRVIDGDTLVLRGGERVRLLGVDTPEKGQPFSLEAKRLLEELAGNRTIALAGGMTDRDKYGRLLRYAWADGTFVNLALIQAGYASVLIIGPDRLHADLLQWHEAAAQDRGLGIWSLQGEYCLGIYNFHPNARGDDNLNLADEYVVFRNKCAHPLDLQGWLLQDAQENRFVFPSFTLPGKSVLTLHTGPGDNNATDLFWGRPRAVWNNAGDTLVAWDRQGKLHLNFSS